MVVTVLLLVAAHAGWSPDFCAPGVDDPEGGLIQKHYSLPVLLSPVKNTFLQMTAFFSSWPPSAGVSW